MKQNQFSVRKNTFEVPYGKKLFAKEICAEEIFAEFIFANLGPIHKVFFRKKIKILLILKNLFRTFYSFSHPQKFIPQNNGAISLFGTNMEKMGNKQENTLRGLNLRELNFADFADFGQIRKK